MTTRETMGKLPENIRSRIESYRKSIKEDYRYRELYIALSSGYLDGLQDAGVITETDKRVLKVYRTV